MPNPRFEFRTKDGKKIHGSEVIFPIVKSVEGKIHLVGTGFYITTNGFFVTAKHVLQDAFDDLGNQIYPMAVVHFFPNNKFQFRNILRCCSHNKSDLAVGITEAWKDPKTGKNIENRIVTLTIEPPRKGTQIITWAYPHKNDKIDGTTIDREGQKQILNFKPNFYDGTLVEHFPDGRDKVMLPHHCYQGDLPLYGGASGGPVFDEKDRVFAINCSSFDGCETIAYFTSTHELLELWVEDVTLNPKIGPQRISLLELGKLGHILFSPKISKDSVFRFPDEAEQPKLTNRSRLYWLLGIFIFLYLLSFV